MFTLESVKSILETEFDIKLTIAYGFVRLSGKNDDLEIMYCDWTNKENTITITKQGLGNRQLELTHFAITNENQLRQFIEQSKKVLAFYDTI